MRKSKIIISLLLIISILVISVQSLAKDFALNVIFDGKTISMESEDTDMTYVIEDMLPGEKDTSTITISNTGRKVATIQTSINIEEDTGLLEMIDLKITDKNSKIIYTGAYKDLTTINTTLEPKETETYTIQTGLNVEAGNEYQNKQYKLKLDFVATGEIPYGTINIKYVDENGEEIKEVVPRIETAKITSDPLEIEEEGIAITDYRFDRLDGDIQRINGKVFAEYTEEGSNVVYHYNKIRYGTIKVLHVDEEGNIFDQWEDTKEVGAPALELNPMGNEYSGYRLTSVKLNDMQDVRVENGMLKVDYVEGVSTVTYHYSKIKYGNLILKCVDEDNNILWQNTKTEEVGISYFESEVGKEIPEYRFERVEGDVQGTYKEQDTIITYHYKKIKYGNLILKYVDENNNILEQNTKTQEVDVPYSENEEGKEISGYKFERVEGNVQGTYKEQDTIIIYHYTKIQPEPEIKKGKLILKYVDENGKLLDQSTKQENVGTSYSESEIGKVISGYNFERVEGEVKGTYKEEDTIITYHYNKIKKGKLILKYVDENGNSIAKDEITTKNVGESYYVDEKGKDIAGYTFIELQGEKEGTYKEQDTIITYKYKKIEYGKIIIRYVDEYNKVMQEDITTQIIGTEYKYLEEQLKKEIPEYKFVSAEGELEGNYKKEDIIIICHYAKIKYGKLIVKYVDENDKILEQYFTIEEVGKDYKLDSKGKKFEGYKFVSVEGETSGKYKQEDTIVTYKYEKEEAPTTNEVTLPKTGQFIYLYIVLGAIIIGLTIWLIKEKNKKDKKETVKENSEKKDSKDNKNNKDNK